MVGWMTLSMCTFECASSSLCAATMHRHHAMNSAAVLLYAFTSGEPNSTYTHASHHLLDLKWVH